MCTGLGSTYSDTFDGTIGRDGTSMDISTDGATSKMKSKKRGKFKTNIILTSKNKW